MYAVAEKHFEKTGKASMCFHFLDVGRFLRNEKLGQVLNGESCTQKEFQNHAVNLKS